MKTYINQHDALGDPVEVTLEELQDICAITAQMSENPEFVLFERLDGDLYNQHGELVAERVNQ